jgi:hypothetical protein
MPGETITASALAKRGKFLAISARERCPWGGPVKTPCEVATMTARPSDGRRTRAIRRVLPVLESITDHLSHPQNTGLSPIM